MQKELSLALIMLKQKACIDSLKNSMKLDINANENSVDPDQLAFKKPADQDPLYFPHLM